MRAKKTFAQILFWIDDQVCGTEGGGGGSYNAGTIGGQVGSG